MRFDRNFAVFAGQSEWYQFVNGRGYVPTDKAPEEAKKAMEKYNSYAFNFNKTKKPSS